eukprot:CAMPEP_0184862534 /NCGR_PEP_ID=MMETSP0580-20130426/6990_1 /TAXON_ID=1118495 /ORGANISM="Dactyliosolen fragilissimus" /LENGTH=483 /DNA_ID=CAMNT_0027360457 /DNA_START=69 /DNA_END=1520 /DNA_ORIENTATION=-
MEMSSVRNEDGFGFADTHAFKIKRDSNDHSSSGVEIENVQDLRVEKNTKEFTPERNVFSELNYMTNLSNVIYNLVFLRQMANQGKIVRPERFLEFPITMKNVADGCRENQDQLKELMGTNLEVVQRAVKSMRDEVKNMTEKRGHAVLMDLRKNRGNNGVVGVGDDSTDHNLVYGVVVDSVNRRVVVVFRGTTETKDIIADVTFGMIKYDQPYSGYKKQAKHIAVHCGWFTYLFENHVENSDVEVKKGSKVQSVKSFTIFDKIFELAISHLKRNPGFSLWVTGHSMGGALATLFAFTAAAKEHECVQGPVTCISVASPKVGDTRFRKTHEWAEQTGLLRHLRVANKYDLVPMIPEVPDLCFWSSCLFIIAYHPASRYRHTGVQINLDPTTCEISYPKLSTGVSRVIYDLVMCSFKVMCIAGSVFTLPCTGNLHEHSVPLYAERVAMHEEQLSKLTIDDVYKLYRKNLFKKKSLRFKTSKKSAEE